MSSDNYDTVIDLTIEHLILLKKFEPLRNKNIELPKNIKDEIDMELSNHEFAYALLVMLLNLNKKDKILLAAKSKLSEEEYNDFEKRLARF